MRTCQVEDCSRKHKARGYCTSHYASAWKKGVVGTTERRTCSVADCDRAHAAKGLCKTHAVRFQKTGVVPTTPITPRNPYGYLSMHARMRWYRGAAKAHPCSHCSAQALDWAYDHSDPNEVTENGIAFSLDYSRYFPLCRKCHVAYDKHDVAA